MSTTKTQRIGIWIIAIFMAIGTVGSFAIIVLANNNGQKDQARLNELTAQYTQATKDYQVKVDAQAKELSDKYYSVFSPYQSKATAFDKASVTDLKTQDFVIGDGAAITSNSSFSAYYIGWNPDGKIFDSSIKDGTLKAPLAVTPGGVIPGWTKGVDGMKIGGIRELTIPSSLAYGEAGSGDSIPANTPLKFVVMIIPTPEAIAQPQIPQELLNYYQKGRLQ